MRIGVGYRRELARWIASHPPALACLEITAEHFFDFGEDTLARLRGEYPLMVHALGLSLGTPGPLDREYLDRVVRVADLADAMWVSEHIAFTRTSGVDLGHLNAVPCTRDSLDVLVDHTIELRERCGRPVLLENPASHLRPPGEMSEPEFLNQLFERAGCGMLLDVTNLYVNARNHGFDPRTWLGELDLAHVRQLHMVGYSRHEGRYEDTHSEAIQGELFELASEVIARARNLEVVTLERDANFPSFNRFAEEFDDLVFALGAQPLRARAAGEG